MNNPAEVLGPPVIGFHEYDEALQKFFSVTISPDPNDKTIEPEVLVPTMGPPRIEYGTQDKLTGIPADPDSRLNQTVKVPALSLSRLNYTFIPSRWTRAQWRKLKWSEDGNRIVQSDQPMPFDVMYQLDVWTKYRSQMNQIIRAITLKFVHREVWVPVNLGGPHGTQNIPLFMTEGPKDLTHLDDMLTERRVRNVYSFNLQAWIMPDATTLPTVRKEVITTYLDNKGVDFPPIGEPIPDSWILANKTILKPEPGDNNP